jgi:hypothetical protein
MNEAYSCNATAECQWEEFKADPLFTKEFCHPVKTAGTEMTSSDWEMCLQGQGQADCVAPCVWNNGVDLIPDHEYCAPAMMTNEVSTIMNCVQANQSDCSGQCKWRKGKDVASNVDFEQDKDLFTVNFCHPAQEAFVQDLDKCIAMDTQQVCEASQCIWSTGKEVAPETDFCAPAKATMEYG